MIRIAVKPWGSNILLHGAFRGFFFLFPGMKRVVPSCSSKLWMGWIFSDGGTSVDVAVPKTGKTFAPQFVLLTVCGFGRTHMNIKGSPTLWKSRFQGWLGTCCSLSLSLSFCLGRAWIVGLLKGGKVDCCFTWQSMPRCMKRWNWIQKTLRHLRWNCLGWMKDPFVIKGLDLFETFKASSFACCK